MNETTRTAALPGTASGPADNLRVTVSRKNFLEWIYKLFTSMGLALVLLFILALLTLAGSLLEQVPAGMTSDPQAYAAWLDSIRPKYGGWTGVLDVLGLFAVFTSIWFKACLVLLSTSVITCSVRRAPGIWRHAARPRIVMTDTFFSRAPLRAKIASQADPEAALAKLRSAFRLRGFRTAIKSDGDAVYVCADRFRWAPFGRVIAHVSFVIILIGAAIGASSGFRNNDLTIPVGSKMAVGHGTGITVLAKSFSDSYYPSGEPSDYSSQLVLYKNGAPVKTQTVRVNHPMHYGGVTFYQSYFGPAAAMQVKGLDGKVLFNDGVPLVLSSGDNKDRIGQFDLPTQGLTVYVVGAASGEVDPDIPAGSMQLEIHKTGVDAPMAVRVVSQAKPTKIAGLDFTFARERQFTGLIVARDPGSFLVWIGSTLLVLGMAMVFFFPHRRVRAVVRPSTSGSETGVATVLGRRDTAFEAQFLHLVDDIELAVTRAGATSERGA